MLRVATLLCLIGLCLAGTVRLSPRPRLDGRIVGGSSASIASFPHQLSLQSGGSHICGASIISNTWAVTAAHCVVGSSASRITLRAGSSNRGSGGTVHQASRIIVHSSYNSNTIDYDIAVISVSSAFVFGTNVRAIALATQGQTIAAGTSATVTGWGTTSEGSSSLPTVLQQVAVPVVANAACNSAYGGGITARMLCAGFTAGGRDACQGDSGGPLISGGRLIGVVSWGYGCARPNYPGVYASVPNLRSWIATNSGV